MEINFRKNTGVRFDKFYNENKQPLTWYLTKWTRDVELAEDFAEDAFILALKRSETYDGQKAKLNTWLYTIAVNLMKKKYSEKKKNMYVSLDKPFGDESKSSLAEFVADDDNYVDRERERETKVKARIVRDAIYALPEKYVKYKTVLVLREIENLAYDEISEYLKINLSTVKSQIRKGRELIAKKVRHQLELVDEHGADYFEFA